MTTIELVLLGSLTVTSYQAVPAQTKPDCKTRYHCTTAIDDGITMYGCAVSQDLLKAGKLKYGDIILVPGFGYRVVNDAMGLVKHENGRPVSIKNSVDLLVFSTDEEKVVGVRHLDIYRLERIK